MSLTSPFGRVEHEIPNFAIRSEYRYLIFLVWVLSKVFFTHNTLKYPSPLNPQSSSAGRSGFTRGTASPHRPASRQDFPNGVGSTSSTFGNTGLTEDNRDDDDQAEWSKAEQEVRNLYVVLLDSMAKPQPVFDYRWFYVNKITPWVQYPELWIP